MSVHRSKSLLTILAVCLCATFLLVPVSALAQSAELFVNDGDVDAGDSWGISAAGFDTNSGTVPSEPVRTIDTALQIAKNQFSDSSSVTIKIGAGEFDGGYTIDNTYYTPGQFRILGSDTTANDTTSILGNGSGDSVGFSVSGGTVSIKYLTVENFGGGGLDIDGDNFTLRQAHIRDNGGTGVNVAGSNPVMDTVTIDTNSGGGMIVSEGDDGSIWNVHSRSNAGIGLGVYSSSDVSVDSASVRDNGDPGVVNREGENNQFEMMEVRENGGDGFLSTNHDSGVFRDLTVVENDGDGMQLDTSPNPLLENIRSDTNGSGASDNGFTLRNSGGAIIRSDTASGNGGDGLLVQNSSGDSLTDLTIRDNDVNGITIEESADMKLDTSVVGDNGQNGVELSQVNGMTIKHNIIQNEDTLGDNGFFVQDSDNLDFRRNEVTEVGGNSGDWAFDVQNSSNDTFVRNYVGSSGDGGLYFDNSENLNFQRNEVRSPNSAGTLIEMDGSTDFDTFVHNNFDEGSSNSVINDDGPVNIDIRYNFWGTTDESTIRGFTQDISFSSITPYRFSKIDTQTSDIRLRSAPAIPESFEADTSISGQVKLSWTQPDRMQGGFGSGERNNEFRIYRSDTNSLDGISDWHAEADTFRIRNSSDTTFTDTGVGNDTVYYYRVTAWDTHENQGRNFEAESYFSKEIKASPEDYGPEIYVNDDETDGDTFTQRVGDNTRNGTRQHPLLTLSRALEVSESGDTIFVDAGTYGDTAVVEDTGGVTIVGAGSDSTVFDGSSGEGPILETKHSADGVVEVRDLKIENSDTGVRVDGTDPTHLKDLIVEGGTTGVMVSGDAPDTVTNSLIINNRIGVDLTGNNTYMAQNQIDSNATYQVRIGGTGNTVRRNNIIPSATNPDSGVSGSGSDLTYNWWNTPDSSDIQVRADETDYIPFRLGKVDTGVGADSIAPSIDTTTIDTGTPQQLKVSWNKPAEGDLEGYRVFRLNNETDTPDWTQHRIDEINDVNDTTYIDTDIQKDTGYSYRVTAFDDHSIENESYFSDVVSGTWVNRDPVADSINLRTQVDSPIRVVLSGTDVDGDTLAYFIEEFPDSATLDTTAIDVAEGIDTGLIYRPDTGAAGTDTFVYRVEDGDGGRDTTTVTIRILVETSIKVLDFKVDGEDTPLIAGSTDTFSAQVVYENTKTGPGAVIRDPSSLSIRNGLGEVVNESFDVSVDTRVRVNGMDTSSAQWVIQLPDSGDTDQFGNFSLNLNYDTEHIIVENVLKETRKPIDTPLISTRRINILPAPIRYDGTLLDTAHVSVQSVDLEIGDTNGKSVIDTGTVEPDVKSGDSIFRMVQRGGTESIDTPIVNPRYQDASADQFDTELSSALEDLKGLRNRQANFNTRNLEILPEDLLLLSIWRENDPLEGSNLIGSSDDYLGDSDVLQEPSRVRVRNVNFRGNTERLSVVKLLPEKVDGEWQWIEVDDLSDPGDITGSEGNYTVRFHVPSDLGFSVFQIVVTGVVKDAPADKAVVYPNPFVPHDGNERTGCYPGSYCGDRWGIHFGAGEDRGFPSGTEIKIYTIKGELVDEFSLFNGGIHQWDARTRNGDPVASGVYIYRIETPGGSELNGKFAIVR